MKVIISEQIISVCIKAYIFNINFLNFLGTRECKDLNIDVQCDHRVRATRETHDEDGGTYVISAIVPAEP